MSQLIDRGWWDENISWELHAATVLPKPDAVSAVFCVAIDNDKVVLMRAKRGWGLLGGHVEPNETLLQALTREAEEEGGFSPHSPTLFAYRKLTAVQPVFKPDGQGTYPFPHSYLAYYYATTTVPIAKPTGSEVLESRAFDMSQLEALQTPDLSVIQLGLEFYTNRAFSP